MITVIDLPVLFYWAKLLWDQCIRLFDRRRCIHTYLNAKLYIGSVTSDTSHDSPLKEMESNYNSSLSCWCQHRYMCMLHFGLPQKSGKGIVVEG